MNLPPLRGSKSSAEISIVGDGSRQPGGLGGMAYCTQVGGSLRQG